MRSPWPHLSCVCTALALLGLACRAASHQAFPAAADTTVLAAAIAPAELPDGTSPGAHLVEQYCSQCHAIPSPGSHSAADWQPTLRRMLVRMERGHRMGGRGGRGGMGGMMGRGMGMGMHVAIPTEAERRSILAYLQSHGLRTIAEDSLPEAGGESSGLFARSCSRCHALPTPAQHTAAEWPAVVARMRGNMLRFGVDTLSDTAAGEIVAYLQRAAGAARPAPR